MPGLAERYKKIQGRLQDACRSCGRDPSEVQLLAVSKTFPVESVRELYALGQQDFGENFVQEGQEKASIFSTPRWHLIGPLQRNKVRPALEVFDTLHAIDRWEIAERVDRIATKMGRTVRGFVQVRLGDEGSKSGIDPKALMGELERWNDEGLESLRLIGLMTIPPPEGSRPYFAQLRELRDMLKAEDWPLFTQYQLSMGMSDDFEDAIAEGSNWVRVGRALFGARKKPI